MAQVLKFARNPNLPVLSNWVVDLDAFFDTSTRARQRARVRAREPARQIA
jgi:hypothetical protein